MGTSTWSEEDVANLTKWWDEGWSGSMIAAELGRGRTRNAVIGKIHRLNLTPRLVASRKPINTGDRAKRKPWRRKEGNVPYLPTASKSQPPPSQAARKSSTFRRLEGLPVPVNLSLPLMDITNKTCKWPHGHPGAEDFGFCGQPPEGNNPYCLYHCNVAYQEETATKRRKRGQHRVRER